MFKKILALIFILTLTYESHASVIKAAVIYKRYNGNPKTYRVIARELAAENAFYAAVPFIKEYMVDLAIAKKKSDIDDIIDKIIRVVGIQQFEVMPNKFLNVSRSPTVRYIIAKKLFRAEKYEQSLKELRKGVPYGHPMKPFALLLEGSINTIQGKHKAAGDIYEECINASNSLLSSTKEANRKEQLMINRDYCIVGIPRSLFANKEYQKADLSYLDLPKDSYIWPEILFEEAWNSFYQKNYNRSLGKLVTYQAPVLDFIFNPEIEVLKAMSYLEMCLWSDAKKTVDDFYDKYREDADDVKRLLKRHGRDYKFYYKLARARERGEIKGSKLLNVLLNSIIHDSTYREILDSFIRGKNEIVDLRGRKLGSFKKVVMRNVRDSLILSRDLIGSYVRKTLLLRWGQMYKAFEGMSYIKLEVLDRKKAQLYRWQGVEDRKRGDIQYLKRNDKQYFWTFNGEFWADELGDYVFALRSECDTQK